MKNQSSKANAVTNRCLMIVAAGALQIPAIEEARALGVRTVAVDANPQAPGMAMADAAHVVDILDAAAVTEIARAERISGVLTLCTDAPVRTVAAVASALNLCALSPAAARNATDKRQMRRALSAATVPVPHFCEVESIEDTLASAALMGYPLALKVACSSGSRGVYRVESAEDLARRFVQARAHQPSGQLLLEEWIEGPEVSVEGACHAGRVFIVQITDKLLFPGAFPVEAGHAQPSQLDVATVARIREVAEAGVRALCLSNCAFHAELKVTGGEPKVVEIGARLGGDRIATHLTPLSTGVNMVKAAIEIALGECPDLTPSRSRGSAVRYFHTDGCGVVEQIEGLNLLSSLLGIEMIYAASERDGALAPGFVIGKIQSSLDRYGHVIFSGDNAEEAVERAKHAAGMVRFHFYAEELQRTLQ